jgi:hypothetical protein
MNLVKGLETLWMQFRHPGSTRSFLDLDILDVAAHHLQRQCRPVKQPSDANPGILPENDQARDSDGESGWFRYFHSLA